MRPQARTDLHGFFEVLRGKGFVAFSFEGVSHYGRWFRV